MKKKIDKKEKKRFGKSVKKIVTKTKKNFNMLLNDPKGCTKKIFNKIFEFIKNNRYRLTTIVTPNKRKNSKLLLNKLFGVFIKAIFSSMNAPIETEIKIVKNINA